MTEERRLYTRFTVEEMDVRTARISRTEVDIRDISPMGISVVGPRKLRIGKEYLIRFGSADQPVAVKGTVRWEMLIGSRKISEEEVLPLYVAGLEFSNILGPAAAPIINFIAGNIDHAEQRLKAVRFKITSGEKAVLNCVETCSVKIISLGGMLIETRTQLQVGTAHAMELLLPDDDSVIPFTGRITHCSTEPKENAAVYRVGIEFSEMSEEGRARLKVFTESLKGNA